MTDRIFADVGDLGLARNLAVAQARGRYVAFIDGDDLWGCRWLRQAYDYARDLRESLRSDDFVLHTEYLVMFGAEQFIHRCIGDDSPEFDAKDLLQWNQWSALAFAPKSVFERFPYRANKDGFGFEDLMFNVETLGAGLKHRCVPESMHAIRLKRDLSSLAARTVMQKAVCPKMPLYERRDLPDAQQRTPDENHSVSPEVHKQALFIHHQIGERLLQIHQGMGIRRYPPQRIWNDQAFLRDLIGDIKHVVLVRDLNPGGAEKYAIDWASAIVRSGEKCVIIETEPKQQPGWVQRAIDAGVKVIPWKLRTEDLTMKEAADALGRALIQADLESVFVCNSPVGWGLVHDNAQVLAKRVFASSFAVIPFGHGFTSTPAYYLKTQAPNLKIVTDNHAQAELLSDHNNLQCVVIEPHVTYSGPTKRSKIEKKHYRILWAGRGTMEKRPEVLPALAGVLEGKADIHVWGDVKPMNAPENLKYRGPFDGFENIDGVYDCYLMTSLFEGMPNTALEATLADLPVVGPRIGGLPEIAVACYDKFDPVTVGQLLLAMCTDSPSLTDRKEIVTKWANAFDAQVMQWVTM